MTDGALRRYHAPVWNEPVVSELGRRGERGIFVPSTENGIRKAVGPARTLVPKGMRRRVPPRLPELSQPQVLRHFLRLSQSVLGMDLNIDLGEGTCTMKHSPKVHEEVLRRIAEVHPLQDPETIQGLLEILYEFGHTFLREISGLDAFSFQPGGGSEAVYTNACILRKHLERRGELETRNEIITTIFSHPCDAASPATAGFKIVTLYPDERMGRPTTEALKAAVSKHTAGLFITNPEDTGIFNTEIDEWTRIVHEAGGLCAYDQANANAILGVTRAREAGFDMGFFNLHKTFSSPHGSDGPACGAVGVTRELERYLPVPVVTFDGSKYRLEYDRPDSIGKVRDFLGSVPVVVRAYAWALSLGADGLRQVAETSMLNNRYLEKKILAIPGVGKPYAVDARVDQIRYSWQKLKDETGVGTEDIERRMVDYGIQSYFLSHHPWVVPEPFTPEPCETYSKADIDYWATVLRQVAAEAYADPQTVKSAPHRSSISKMDPAPFDDPARWAMTWRAFLRKRGAGERARGTAGPRGP
ncbi:MAG: glycine dehydrogenase [Euryarchaeota archaeon RBG_16_68_13]|nr:MAG: glycine dehydrogenase [Euryarchaeota archaeon RBG_16_68_13]